MSLKEAVEEKDLRLLPHSGTVLAHMVRFNLRAGSVELANHLKEAKLRGNVVLGLGRELVKSGHRAYVNQSLPQKPLRKAAAKALDTERRVFAPPLKNELGNGMVQKHLLKPMGSFSPKSLRPSKL